MYTYVNYTRVCVDTATSFIRARARQTNYFNTSYIHVYYRHSVRTHSTCTYEDIKLIISAGGGFARTNVRRTDAKDAEKSTLLRRLDAEKRRENLRNPLTHSKQ